MASVILVNRARNLGVGFEQRTTVLLVAAEGLTNAEAATATGAPVG
jgi:hypothetical protein